ncbi:hypothetical protein OUZ56_020511 [Daphnia magna]|uniref:Uncharacterized protein n=1 Tax=Daphnia magna TaxID=35525 RepID=A0ABQ9ZEN8_9CRUS|nr:hypothetical protein OUZ56_020511 [Daphnia magna]
MLDKLSCGLKSTISPNWRFLSSTARLCDECSCQHMALYEQIVWLEWYKEISSSNASSLLGLIILLMDSFKDRVEMKWNSTSMMKCSNETDARIQGPVMVQLMDDGMET